MGLVLHRPSLTHPVLTARPRVLLLCPMADSIAKRLPAAPGGWQGPVRKSVWRLLARKLLSSCRALSELRQLLRLVLRHPCGMLQAAFACAQGKTLSEHARPAPHHGKSLISPPATRPVRLSTRSTQWMWSHGIRFQSLAWSTSAWWLPEKMLMSLLLPPSSHSSTNPWPSPAKIPQHGGCRAPSSHIASF